MTRPRALRLKPLEPRLVPTVTPVGAEFRTNIFTAGAQSAPAVAVDGEGDVVIVWESNGQDGGGFGIYGRRYDKTGTALGGEFLVNSVTTEWQRSPAVACDADGDFVVVFESYAQDGDGYGIYARRYDKNGAAQGAAFLVNTTTADSQVRPAVAMDDSGDFVVGWESYAPTTLVDVWYQRYNAAGTPQGVETRANSITTQFQGNPAVALDSDGDFVIAWQSYTTDGDGYGVYARRFNALGVPAAADFRVNQMTTGQQQEAAVALDADGDFVVAWESFAQDGSGYGVYARRYNSAGTALTGEFRVNSTTASDQRTPAVSISAAGEFVVLWSSLGQEAANFGIYGQRYLASGTTDGGELHVNTFTANHQTQPAIDNDACGNFTAVWQSMAQDGSDAGAYAQRYSVVPPAPPPIVQSVAVNDGTSQRSSVTYVTVTFNSVVTLPANPVMAFTLTGPNGEVALGANTSLSTPTNTVVRLTFSGPNTTANSLNDGKYTLTVVATSVTGAGGALDGNSDGIGADNFEFGTHRLFGDSDGDGDVDASDFAAFRLTYGTTSGSLGYVPALDADGDGDVDASDFGQFRLRYGTTV